MPLARQTWFNGRKTAKLAHFERPQTRERADQSEQRKKNVLDETRFPCDFLLFLGALFFATATTETESFTGFYRVLLGFTGFYQVFIAFHWV